MNDLSPTDPHQPDAEVLAAQDMLRERGLGSGDVLTLPIGEARAATYRFQAFLNEGGPETETAEHSLPISPPVRVRLYRPRGVAGTLPAYLHVHGGGFTVGNIDSMDRWKREVADQAGIVVVGLEYALSPEHAYPTAVEQVVAVLRWLQTEATALGIDPGRIGLGGDSAGGNAALAALLRLRDAGDPLPRFGAIVYGMLSANHESASHRAFGDGRFGLSTERMEWFWTSYLGGTARDDAGAVPLHARFEGLPPMLLLAAGLDPLLDDTLEFGRRLTAAGVPHEMKVYSGVPHGFLGQTRLLTKARQAQGDVLAAIARYLN
ncbi:alpha/beta hydrolase [Roseomonas marmotae]|uniref:Alpha/beta hydrolase n=1 Tax=Roseomonas marmotae TaxID=2768161 RepID=A0ABS3KGC7_9PROT|nr:alpha/beta hydrolase [Roseomonas marmotae]MBO1076524.1 alpha/beta hydrolase [Roseomonas marmotae]QTI81859.1 alpha/beta hydrolase [Roseomonas marmotae]